MEPEKKPSRPKTKIWKFLTLLGPGLTTGAADDDPSGIATYSQTGAQFGYGQLWTALYMLPFMMAVQEACARIGLVTGKGIAALVKTHYSKTVLYSVVGLVVIANTINIGADIGAMAEAVKLLIPVSFTVITTILKSFSIASPKSLSPNSISIVSSNAQLRNCVKSSTSNLPN